LEPRSVALPGRAAAESVPVARITLDTSIGDVIDDLGRILPGTEFSPALLEQVREAYAPGVGMSEAFGRWLERTLGDRGLVVYDASDPASKSIVADVFARELSGPGQTARLAAAAGAELTARGYHSQVQPQDDSLALFRIDTGRRAIRQQAGQFLLGEPASR